MAESPLRTKRRRTDLSSQPGKADCKCPYHNHDPCVCVYHDDNLREDDGCCLYHSSTENQPLSSSCNCVYHNGQDHRDISNISSEENESSSSSVASSNTSSSDPSEESVSTKSAMQDLPMDISPSSESSVCDTGIVAVGYVTVNQDNDSQYQEGQEEGDTLSIASCGSKTIDSTTENFCHHDSSLSRMEEELSNGNISPICSNDSVVESHRNSFEIIEEHSEGEEWQETRSASSLEHHQSVENRTPLPQENSSASSVEMARAGRGSPPSSDHPPSNNSSSGDSSSSSDSSSSVSSSDSDDGSDDEVQLERDLSESDDPDVMTLTGQSLREVLQLVEGCSVADGVALVLALTVRHDLPYVAAIHLFVALNTLMQKRYFPTSKKGLWRVLKEETTSTRKHGYCDRCLAYLGLVDEFKSRENPNADVVCVCGYKVSPKKIKYFITLSMEKQLKGLLKKKCSWENLQYRLVRQKTDENAVEDILDGEGYKDLVQKVNLGPSDFTYLFNTDGFSLSHSSKLKAWPLFVRLNEVRPGLRQQYVILASLWVDRRDPPMNLFLQAFVDEANVLSSRGITWETPDGDPIRSRFFPTCCCADAKARAPMLNMMQGNGAYGCTFCEHCGLYLAGSMKYPLPGVVDIRRRAQGGEEDEDDEEEIVIPEPQLRTHGSITTAMISATPNAPIRGVKGPSELMNLHFFNLAVGFSTDDLHNFKGCAEFHTQRFFEDVGEPWYIGTPVNRKIIDNRLIQIKTPSSISRKTGDRTLDTMPTWKASEWRNWLLYYAIPCLQGLFEGERIRYLKHFGLLCRAVFLLTRDKIREEDFVEADVCIQEYLVLFQRYFQPEKMRFNVHVLGHAVLCARTWGPHWGHSTAGFESFNHRLGKTVKSPKDPAIQIVRRYFIARLVDNLPFDDNVSERVKDAVQEIMTGEKFRQSVKIGECRLFGRPLPRNANDAELNMMREHGYACNRITEYGKAKVWRMEIRSVLSNDDARSDNRYVYTRDDCFCKVASIVVFEANGRDLCGIFADQYEVGDPVCDVSHIVPVVRKCESRFFLVENVRNSAIKISISGKDYIMPLSNQYEID